MSDPYRNDPERPVVYENSDSGMGVIAGIAVVALLIIGGFLFYNYHTPTTVATNMAPSSTTTAPAITPSRPAPAPAPSAAPSNPAPTAPSNSAQ
jgi:hypothetical protein